ncbi:hypothetical protein [Streptomyces sp. ATCC 21386]|uniref:hypothetical protein n=1 Tax=Streptomyces sp. ATCC 21386 TaxID=2699428 RepID=UPI001BFFB9C2|nr:hypothetical protein [Streptomyces sp. ATCC 21386]
MPGSGGPGPGALHAAGLDDPDDDLELIGFVGARLAHAHLRGRKPGRGLTVDQRTGELINVQIPETVLDTEH